jgi:cell division topological specificity factor
MLENFTTFIKKKGKKEPVDKSKNAAKERLHLVLMQDRANVSADFLEMMKLEIVDVIKKYIDVDETDMDVKLENRVNDDGTSGAPALYANIPIVGINEEKKKESIEIEKEKAKQEEAEKKEAEKQAEKKKKTVSKKVASTKKASTKTEKSKPVMNAKIAAENAMKKMKVKAQEKKIVKKNNSTKE